MDAYLSSPLVVVIRQERLNLGLTECKKRIDADGNCNRTRGKQFQELLDLSNV